MTLLSEWLLYIGLLCGATALSATLTEGARCLALRWGVLDHPAGRKIHHHPTPLLGGAAIVATFYIVTLAGAAVVAGTDRLGVEWLRVALERLLGPEGERKAIGILAGGLLMFLLGVVDDLKALRPKWKLAGQVAISLLTVWFGVRAELFIFRDPVTSTALTVFWLVLITNSMNLLDNMDGLCGGISVIAAATLALAMQPGADMVIARALLVAARGKRPHLGRDALVGLILLGLFEALFAFSRDFRLSLVFAFFGGMALIACFALLSSLVQLIATDEMRGRVMSLYNIAFRGGMPIGSLVAGALTPVFGIAAVVGSCGILLTLLAAYLLVFHRRLAAL